MSADKIISKLVDNIIKAEASDSITIAEVFNDIDKGINARFSNTVLVSPSLISKIKPSHINTMVDRNYLGYDSNKNFRHQSWIYISPSLGLKKTETLVESWEQNTHTILSPSHDFLACYGLSPRISDELIHWDDLAKPTHDIVTNKPLSYYEYPNHSHGLVKVKKDYLEDYALRRKKQPLRVFQEIVEIENSEEINALLNENGLFEKEYGCYHVYLFKQEHSEGMLRLEVTGYQSLIEDITNYETSVEDVPNGHKWKGIDELINSNIARHKRAYDYVYVSDEVLAKYEGKEQYNIYPESGSVYYKNQWGITCTNRIGRNGIKLELKRLYEGLPYDEIDHWNKFSIEKSQIDESERNIVEFTSMLVRHYLLFSELLSRLLNEITDLDILSTQVISLSREKVDSVGFCQIDEIKPLTYHINPNSFTKDQFLNRCKNLYKVFGENIKEKRLRKIVLDLGFDEEQVEKFRSIKLLELIICFISTYNETGLHPRKNKEAIIQRIEPVEAINILDELRQLSKLRNIDAHKMSKSKKIFDEALKVLGVDRNTITDNYTEATYQAYQALDDLFIRLNDLLVEASNFK